MPYYLGIDGGGSKTACAVGDATSLLASVTTGPSNVVRVGEARARESLQEAVRSACAAAGITPRQVERTCIGAAGAAREEVSIALRRSLSEVLPGEIKIVGDMEIALAAAFGSGPGVIVIAGTGSIAYGRDAQGKTARAGGWGFAISDEGSAHWIGRTALSAALRSVDEASNPNLPLLHEMMKMWQLNSPEDLVRAANFHGESAAAGSAPDFAAFFPAVLAAAEAGDAVAIGVLTAASSELARLASVVVRRLSQLQGSSPAVPMAMVGGVFRHAARVRELFYNEVRRVDPRVVLRPEVIEPVHGALQMARRPAS